MTERSNRKQRTGVVVSKSGTKSVSVLVETTRRHALYGKVFKMSKKFAAHDDQELGNVGDTVEIMECRPISKTKRWRLVRVVEKSKKPVAVAKD